MILSIGRNLLVKCGFKYMYQTVQSRALSIYVILYFYIFVQNKSGNEKTKSSFGDISCCFLFLTDIMLLKITLIFFLISL